MRFWGWGGQRRSYGGVIRLVVGARTYVGQMVRSTTISLLLVLTLVAAQACTRGSDDVADRGAEPSTAESSSTATSTTATSTTGTSAVPSTTVPLERRIEVASDIDSLTPILSPTGNIYCQIQPGAFAECGVLEQDWEPPPQPADCPLDWGETISVGIGGGPADFVCAGDSSYGGPESERLPYGHAVRAGGLTCLSEESGMTCWAEESRRGFTVSRADYRLF